MHSLPGVNYTIAFIGLKPPVDSGIEKQPEIKREKKRKSEHPGTQTGPGDASRPREHLYLKTDSRKYEHHTVNSTVLATPGLFTTGICQWDIL